MTPGEPRRAPAPADVREPGREPASVALRAAYGPPVDLARLHPSTPGRVYRARPGGYRANPPGNPAGSRKTPTTGPGKPGDAPGRTPGPILSYTRPASPDAPGPQTDHSGPQRAPAAITRPGAREPASVALRAVGGAAREPGPQPSQTREG